MRRRYEMEEILVGRELRSLNNLIRRYFEFATHKKEIETITGNNGWIIGYLSENKDRDIYQKDLEEHFTITRSTASRVLSRMEQKGLIERQTVPRDARLKKIVLTEKAWQIKGLMREDIAKLEQTLLKGFTGEEKQALAAYIRRMKQNVTQY